MMWPQDILQYCIRVCLTSVCTMEDITTSSQMMKLYANHWLDCRFRICTLVPACSVLQRFFCVEFWPCKSENSVIHGPIFIIPQESLSSILVQQLHVQNLLTLFSPCNDH
uniref:Uncharacterized protein n=1 Tax=Setaria italica TaxID=4555 RepID=K3YF04_SETIT